MAATKFVVNVDARTGLIRQIVTFPGDDEHDGHLASVLVGRDERQFQLPIELVNNHIELQPIIDKMLGIRRR